jgi:transposase
MTLVGGGGTPHDDCVGRGVWGRARAPRKMIGLWIGGGLRIYDDYYDNYYDNYYE